MEWYAVWGNGSEAGVIGVFATETEARDCVREWNATNDNPACGAWVRCRRDNE